MESSELSALSSLKEDFHLEDFIAPDYKESYRLAIDRLVSDGKDGYREFLEGERIGSFLSEDELLFIAANAERPPPQDAAEETNGPSSSPPSSGTYWPIHSDVATPDLDLGWPEVAHERLQTNIDLLFHPPRQNSPSIKQVIRKSIRDAQQVIAIVMDKFTDVDIFKELVDASSRGVPVYLLLDDCHFKSFLTMAENHDVKIQQLRNMRVRTVRGQDYISRTGAKFHGAMEQKFILVDCHTAIYGSYSFTWSFEKIHLSMVQMIKGHLVTMYDEEFRTLYARSTVPVELCDPEGLFQHNGPQGPQHLATFCPGPKIERRDVLRHTLDAVYRKTCERKLGNRDYESRLLEEEPNNYGALIGINAEYQMSQLRSAEEINLLKRHSYAGERQNEFIPMDIRTRASHWNIPRDTGNGPHKYPKDNFLQVPQLHRGPNMCQSYNDYNDSDQPNLSMQQNVPTLENTSKSFMRTWRIQSYLKNQDVPLGDSSDFLDQFEPMDKAGSFMQGRTMPSLTFRPNVPEQMEPNRHMSSTSGNCVPVAVPHIPMHYTSIKWNPTMAAESRMNSDELMRNSHQSVYASFGRNNGRRMIQNPDLLAEGWNKRHSVADPRSNNEYTPHSSSHMYGPRMLVNRSTAEINTHKSGFGSNLKEEQRSRSHYDVKNINGSRDPRSPNWQEPPSRTVSAAALDVNSKELAVRCNSKGSILAKSSTKIKSMLNIPERKEGSVGNAETSSLRSAESTDTLTAEDGEKSPERGEKLCQTSKFTKLNPVRSLEEEQSNASVPRARTQGHQPLPQVSLSKMSRQKKPSVLDKNPKPSPDTGSWRRNRGAESRLYSRFEPFCSLEKKNSTHAAQTASSEEKIKSLPRAEAVTEPGYNRTPQGNQENKLEKFFHRVGNLMNKNKW